MTIVVPARRLSRSLLAELPDRWEHTQGVAARADELAVALGLDEMSRERLVAAAWLHDVGYSRELQRTGFHPLDGARHLWGGSWPGEIVGLVAQHSGAWFVAEVRGLGARLAVHRVARQDPLLDLLTYADQTVGLGGVPMTVEERIEEAYRRRGPDSPSGRAYPVRRPYLLAVAARVQERLRSGGAAELAQILDIERMARAAREPARHRRPPSTTGPSDVASASRCSPDDEVTSGTSRWSGWSDGPCRNRGHAPDAAGTPATARPGRGG